jgi:hypothetical protein
MSGPRSPDGSTENRGVDRAHEPPRPRSTTLALTALLGERLRVGDAVLTGGDDPVSTIIQIGSRSPYSHVGVVTGPGRLTEAYDYALTPDESDEGIFATPLDEFLGRCDRLRVVEVRRPDPIDPGRLVETARHLERHSPGFPTVGMACLALCGLSDPLVDRLPAELRGRLRSALAALAADGTRGLHCGETATRLYYGAGVALRFRAPRLWAQVGAVTAERPPWHLVDLPTERRAAEAGRWPSGLRAGPYAVRSTAVALRRRWRSNEAIDAADLILPGDFARAEPFRTVARFRRRGRAWIDVSGPHDRAVPPEPEATAAIAIGASTSRAAAVGGRVRAGRAEGATT